MNEDIRITLKNKGFIRNADGSYSKPDSVAPRLPDAQPQPDSGKALDSAPPDEKASQGRVILRITRTACRTVDFDNGAGGCKALIDQLRYLETIQDDRPEDIEFQFLQVKARRRRDEGTLVEIIPLCAEEKEFPLQ